MEMINEDKSQLKVRNLTIAEEIVETPTGKKRLPSIRLKGSWLKDAGFNPYQKVKVFPRERMLIIVLEEESVSK